MIGFYLLKHMKLWDYCPKNISSVYTVALVLWYDTYTKGTDAKPRMNSIEKGRSQTSVGLSVSPPLPFFKVHLLSKIY